jgi:sugar lactone lactonase YvrE
MKRALVTLVLGACSAAAQQYVIETFAGGRLPASTPVPALNTAIAPYMGGVALDTTGNVYFHGVNAVYKLMPDGMLMRFAGTTELGYNGDNRSAVSARLFTDDEGSGWLAGVTVDTAGNVYIADSYNYRVRRVSPDGLITTVAGNGKRGDSGDGGPAVDAQLQATSGLAIDALGNLYIADVQSHRVRKVSTDGIITTIAGNGTQGYSGDGGLAVNAQLNSPYGIAIDRSGNLLIADTLNQRVRRVFPSGIITTVVGDGAVKSAGDSGPAAGASMNHPRDVAVDSAGWLYILEFNRVRRVAPDGVISTLVGNGVDWGDGGPIGSGGIAVAGDGTLYISGGSLLRKLPPGGVLTAAAGNGTRWYGGDGGPVANAQFYTECCESLASDSDGALYIADAGSARIRKVSSSGIITTVAGNGIPGYSGDGGAATAARLMQPRAVAVTRYGELFIADGFNFRIRKVTREGIITTVAGNGTPGHSGDGGDATAASIGHVFGIAVDDGGNLYMAELALGGAAGSTNRIRKVSASGIISTLVHSDLPSSRDQFMALGIAVDRAGNVYFTDHGKHRVLRVSSDGTLGVFAGNGTKGAAGEGGPATEAELDTPISLAVDENDNIYIGEAWSPRVRRVSAHGMSLKTIAGTGIGGHSGDGGPATIAEISPVSGIAFSPAGEIYISAFAQGVIRVLRPVGAGQ